MLIYPIPHCRFFLAGIWHWIGYHWSQNSLFLLFAKWKKWWCRGDMWGRTYGGRGRQRKEPKAMRVSLNLGGKTLRQWLNYVGETAQAFWSCGTIRIPHPSKITSAPIALQCAVWSSGKQVWSQAASLRTHTALEGVLMSLDFIARLRFNLPSNGRARRSLHHQRRVPAQNNAFRHVAVQSLNALAKTQ